MPRLNVREELERFRRELLDTSGRNVLIKFRPTRTRTVAIVDELPDQMYEHLVAAAKAFKMAPAELALEMTNESLASELPPAPPSDGAKRGVHKDDKLHTDLDEEDLERRLKTMLRYATTELEETGGSSLYLNIGFLEWQDHKDPSASLNSPLFLIPVEIEKSFDSRRKRYGFTLRYDGNEIQTNLSLAQKLKDEFGVVLPEIDLDEKPEEYFANVADAIASFPKWRVQRKAVVSFFSFAKLLMFRDLDPALWPDSGAIEKKPLVRAIFEGQASNAARSGLYAQEYSVDATPAYRDMLLAVDADSSQHSALIDVLDGKSMVIEGPPGTGKSQTITNIIAATIAQGKTVLFVAEKMAALEVVQKNLTRAGLGGLCLEMHSHKSKPAQVYASFKERLDTRYSEPGRLQSEAALLEEERRALEQYLQASRLPVGPRREPLFSLFWRAAAIRARGVVPLNTAVKTDISEPQFEERLRFFGELERHTDEVAQAERALWAGFDAVRYFANDRAQAAEALNCLRDGAEAMERAQFAVADGTHKWLDMEWAARLATHQPELCRPTNLLQSMCAALAKSTTRDEVVRVVTTIKRLKLLKDSKPEIWRLSSDPHLAAKCQRLLEQLADGNFMRVMQESTISELRPAAAELEGVLATMERVEDLLQTTERLRLGRPRNPEQFEEFARKYRCLHDPVIADRSVLRPELFFPATRVLLAQAEKRRDDLLAKSRAQEENFLIREAPSRESLGVLRRRLRAHGTGLLRWFSKDFRRAMAEQRAFRRAGSKLKPDRLIAALDSLDEFLSEKDAFATDPSLKRALGPDFKGLESDWNAIHERIEWSQRAMKAGLTFQSTTELLRTLDQEPSPPSVDDVDYLSTVVHQTVSTSLLSRLLGTLGGVWTVPFHDIVEASRAFMTRLLACIAELDELVTLRLNNLDEARATLAEILEVRSTSDRLGSDRVARLVLGDAFKAEESDIAAAEATLGWADLIASQGFPSAIQRWVLSEDTARRADSLSAACLLAGEAWKTWTKGWTQFAAWGTISNGFAGTSARPDWKQVSDQTANMVRHIDSLLAWANLCRALEHGSELELTPFLSSIVAGRESAAHARDRYELTFYDEIGKRAIQKNEALRKFSRQRIEQTRTNFQHADLRVIELARKKLAFDGARRTPPMGNGTGRVRDLTELSLILYEVTKTRAHCKLRQLMIRAGRAVQALKPCFLMSPLTVAQHLPAGEIEFDLLVMDEASQIKPADAIGAIARARQVVVVGDPKQLPPTSFFERTAGDDAEGDDDATMADNAESVLEIGLKAYPHARRLRWHYRSQHESLIAFSNDRFYDGDLIVFPSPTADAGKLGLRHHSVTGASYASSRNLKEAQAVAKAIVEHAHRFPEESLGVGVFNLPQRDLVEECLDQICIQDRRARAAIEALRSMAEPLFIKNLENLQGDERDVIFIGYTYGQEESSGKLQNRFGPITGENGWRRLNVLITRARRRLEVFASFRSEEILGGPDKSRGVNAMKDFLAFVENGKMVDRGVRSGRSPDSPFEEAVGRVVAGLGLGIVPQVGVAGYFVDIGVLAPGRTDEFILGIECDGETYHSAKSARDRDRLREEVIRRRGWTIHRIWSTDWFLNQPAEERRLAQALTDAKRAWESRLPPRSAATEMQTAPTNSQKPRPS